MQDWRKTFGVWAEQRSLEYLREKGFSLVKKNFYCRYGEIDLIVQNEQYQTLVFVEVKARKANAYAKAHEVISLNKQKKMMRSALIFLDQHPEFYSFFARFDVMCLDIISRSTVDLENLKKTDYSLEWIENAFTFDAELINL